MADSSDLALEYGPPLPDVAQYHRISRALKTDAEGRMLRVAVLSSCTMGFLEPFLRVELRRLGVPAELFFGGFGEIESLVLDPASALHRYQPDLVVVALRPEDMFPDLVARIGSEDGHEFAGALTSVIDRVRGLLQSIAAQARWTTLVANFAVPEPAAFGLGDASVHGSRSALVAQANHQLHATVCETPGAFVWDYAGLVRAQGSDRWRDDRLWFLGRIPVAGTHHPAMAQHLARTIRAAMYPMAKVLVLDLDNTLWGGVLGDDGIHGIKMGDDYPGNVFKALQRQVLALRDRGVLLAISSKNDEALVREAFAVHPDLLLRWSDFAAHQVGWGPKSTGIAAMAHALGFGLDAVVFLDDNPVERAEVRQHVPAVKVIEFEAWGSLHRALAACPWFDQLATSAEDRQRATLYANERQRQTLATTHQSVDDYLASLEMTAVVATTTPVERARVAQLIGKTNQFNLTLRRYPEATLAGWIDDSPDHRIAHMRLADRFGDHGIIAAAVLTRAAKRAVIDVFVMSCRVMNRQAELAFLAFLVELARDWGCDELTGEFVSGPRNQIVEDWYRSVGFAPLDASEAGVARWHLPLSESTLAWPAVIARNGQWS